MLLRIFHHPRDIAAEPTVACIGLLLQEILIP